MSVLNSTPSTKNCTCITPTSSSALAEIVIVPLTVAPSAGLPTLVVGGVVSGHVPQSMLPPQPLGVAPQSLGLHVAGAQH